MPITAISGGSQTTKVIGSTSLGLFPQPLHPDVMAYVNAQVSNGYSPSRGRVDALNNLVYALIGNGIYSKCQAIYPFLGGTTGNAQKWNLKNVADTDAAFRLGFQGSWTFAETGVKVTAVSASNYARTYYTPSTNATNNSGHLSAYIRTVYTGQGCIIGGSNGTLATSVAYQIFASTTYSQSVIQGQNTSQWIAYGTSGAAGFYQANRSTSTAQQAYYNGTLKATGTAASSSIASATSELTLASRNGGAFSMSFGNSAEMAFISIGTSLTAFENQMFYEIVQAYQTSLGRQV